MADTNWFLNQKDAAELDVDLMASGYSLDQLMELAGLACAIAIHRRLSNQPLSYHDESVDAPRPVVVLCGPGNNGGDGLVCARHLALWGHSVDVFYPRTPTKQLFLGLLDTCRHMGVRVFTYAEAAPNTSDITSPSTNPARVGASVDSGVVYQRAMDGLHAALSSDAPLCIVDAVFGFGGRAESIQDLKAPYQGMLEAVRIASDSSALLVCVDVPSAWDVEKGDVKHTGIHPDLLISLTAPKLCATTLRRPTEHVVGGRFVPPHILQKYGLPKLPYEGCEQILKL